MYKFHFAMVYKYFHTYPSAVANVPLVLVRVGFTVEAPPLSSISLQAEIAMSADLSSQRRCVDSPSHC